MRLVVDSVEYFERGMPLFKSVYIELKQKQLVQLFSYQQPACSLLFEIICFQKSAVNSYVAIDDQKLYRKPPNMVLMPADGLLPKNISLQLAFSGYGCSWKDFKLALPDFQASQHQKAHTLSAGELRMCELYLCLHLHEQLPHRWILLDQPFKHLSPVYIDKASDWIENAKGKAGILFTDTQTARPELMPDACYTLQNGRISRG